MRRFFATAMLLVLAVDAKATCTGKRPTFAAIDRKQPLATRQAALHDRQVWTVDDSLAPEWRALIADLRADPKASPELLADSEAQLAVALSSDATNAEELALARDAEAIVQANALADRPSHAEILGVLASKLVNNGLAGDAVELVERALEAARSHFGEASWEYARASIAAGSVAAAHGRYEEAERWTGIAEELAKRCLPADDVRILYRMTSHASTLSLSGRLDEALAAHFRAAAWASSQLPESDPAMLFVLNNLGMALRNASRLNEAEAVLRRSVDLGARYQSKDWRERADALGKFANVLDALGRHQEAEALWLRSLEFFARSNDRSNPLGASGYMRRAADAALARGDLKLALERRAEALKMMAAAPPGHPEVARAQLEYAVTLVRAKRVAEAVAMAEPAVAIIRKKFPLTDQKRLGGEMLYVQVVAASQGPAAAYDVAVPVAKRLEATLLDTATAHGDLVTYAPLFAAGFAALTDYALQTGRDEEAFRALQLANLSQIVLVTTDTAARRAAKDPAESALVTALQDGVRKRRQLERSRSFALSSGKADQVTAIQAQITANDDDIGRLTRALDEKFPSFRTSGRPTPVSLAAFRAGLAPDQILLAPLTVADATLAIAVTRDGLIWTRTPVPESKVRRLVQRVRESIDRAREGNAKARFDTMAARGLYDAMIPSMMAEPLRGHASLQYYATGPLAAIPPALLIAPDNTWLLKTHDVTVLPTLAASAPDAAASTREPRFFGIGAPVLAGSRGASRGLTFRNGTVDLATIRDLPSLDGAAGELRAMRTVLGGASGVVLTGPDATERGLKARSLQGFDVLAFATHGLVGGDVPGLNEPALVLTPPTTPSDEDDGLLTASEIAALRLDADWVILSACNTASGGSAGTPEYGGLASAFVQAGARSLLVSHWPVRDDVAARLTVETLRGAKAGARRSVALQRAMLRLMRQQSHPAVWAPFVLIGR